MDEELIYLFTGSAEIFIKNRMKRIIQSHQKIKSTVIKYDMDVTSLATVLKDALTIPFLEKQKIIILKNPRFLLKDDITSEGKELLRYLKNPVETSILLIDATHYNIPSHNEIYKMLKNVALIIHYADSEEIEVKGWVVRTLALEHIEIKDDALTLFMEYLNNDQIRMEQELDKLSAYVGSGGTITISDITVLVPKDLNNEIFSLITALVAKDRTLVYSIYQRLASNTKDSLGIISMIANNFKELLTTARLLIIGYSQSDIAKFYNIQPGRAYYIVKNAKSFPLVELQEYVKKMADLDYQIKSGQLDKNIGIELLLLQF